jgi:hypothetical protein
MNRLKRKIIKHIKTARNTITPVHHLLCLDKKSGQKTSIVFIGWDKKLRSYWLERINNHFKIYQKQSKYLLKTAEWYLNKRKNIGLAIVDKNNVQISVVERHPHFLLPKWMEMVIDLDQALTKSKTKDIVRRIRKYGLEAEFRNQREDVDLFYFNMYAPLISQRHKGSAEIADYRFFMDKFEHGNAQLLFITRNKETIAAQFIEKLENTYRIVSFGILDGRHDIQKMGVHAALYYFALSHFQKSGYKTVLCGSSMPLAFDGVTQFKLRLGAKPYVRDVQQRSKYYILPDLHNKPVFQLMHSNPIFHVSPRGLALSVFIDGESIPEKQDFLKYYKTVKSENTEKTMLHMSTDSEKIKRWIQEENIENIELRNYDKNTD